MYYDDYNLLETMNFGYVEWLFAYTLHSYKHTQYPYIQYYAYWNTIYYI